MAPKRKRSDSRPNSKYRAKAKANIAAATAAAFVTGGAVPKAIMHPAAPPVACNSPASLCVASVADGGAAARTAVTKPSMLVAALANSPTQVISRAVMDGPSAKPSAQAKVAAQVDVPGRSGRQVRRSKSSSSDSMGYCEDSSDESAKVVAKVAPVDNESTTAASHSAPSSHDKLLERADTWLGDVMRLIDPDDDSIDEECAEEEPEEEAEEEEEEEESDWDSEDLHNVRGVEKRVRQSKQDYSEGAVEEASPVEYDSNAPESSEHSEVSTEDTEESEEDQPEDV